MSIDHSLAMGQVAAMREALGVNSNGGGGKPSWLEAIAHAMGQAQGDVITNMVDRLEKIKNLSADAANLTGSRGEKAARDFQVAMTEFQAVAQLFSMLTNANSTSLKAIGEAMTAMARKQ